MCWALVKSSFDLGSARRDPPDTFRTRTFNMKSGTGTKTSEDGHIPDDIRESLDDGGHDEDWDGHIRGRQFSEICRHRCPAETCMNLSNHRNDEPKWPTWNTFCSTFWRFDKFGPIFARNLSNLLNVELKTYFIIYYHNDSTMTFLN